MGSIILSMKTHNPESRTMCFKWRPDQDLSELSRKAAKLTLIDINHSDFQSFQYLFSSGSGWRLNLSALSKSRSWSKPCKNESEQIVLNILKFPLFADDQH